MASPRASRKPASTPRAKTKPSTPRQIPDKPYFKIGEVAALAGVAPSVLRFWETEFRALRPEKTRTNQRVYTRKHAELVLRIRELLYDRGFTIAGARQRLRGSLADGDALENLKKELQDLLRLLDE
jgi:DNA-binding transcriptional MerR regulator